jgi:formyltetrahydrofolate deformylase
LASKNSLKYMKTITILMNCPDQKAIVAAVTGYVAGVGGNVTYLDQHVDEEQDVFFMRLVCDFEDVFDVVLFKKDFSEKLALPLKMDWQVFEQDYRPRMAVFVSKYDHCLYDILGRFCAGELAVEIPVIVSNHLDLKPVAERFGIAFEYVAFSGANKDEGEKQHLTLMEKFGVDFVVLARYMQIITPGFIAVFRNRIINIHHSFLPAFPGAKPYHSAFARGVKIIGATSHYVTDALDEGPIIEQDVTRVSHSHSIADFVMKGRDLERTVLARAIKLHAEHKTMVYANKTVVFS